MLFATAGIEVSPLLPVAAAFGASLFCSMAGISGAFLLLPFQISVLGYVRPGVSATNQIFNILACPAGVFRFALEGRLLLPLAAFIAAGSLPGVFAGAILRVSVFRDARHFMLFVALVLFYLGMRMLLQQKKREAAGSQAAQAAGRCQVTSFSLRGFSFTYMGRTFSVSGKGLLPLSFAVGVVGGIYGIGGGALMSPFLLSFFGLPMHAISGACLLATFLTSVAGVCFYSLLALLWNIPAAGPDWILGLFLGLGGMAGMYCGASMQKHVQARHLRLILVSATMFMACQYAIKALWD